MSAFNVHLSPASRAFAEIRRESRKMKHNFSRLVVLLLLFAAGTLSGFAAPAARAAEWAPAELRAPAAQAVTGTRRPIGYWKFDGDNEGLRCGW